MFVVQDLGCNGSCIMTWLLDFPWPCSMHREIRINGARHMAGIPCRAMQTSWWIGPTFTVKGMSLSVMRVCLVFRWPSSSSPWGRRQCPETEARQPLCLSTDLVPSGRSGFSIPIVRHSTSTKAPRGNFLEGMFLCDTAVGGFLLLETVRRKE